jgi:hypothetical protein
MSKKLVLAGLFRWNDNDSPDIRTVVTFKVISEDKTEMTVTQHADFRQIEHFAKLGLEQSLEKAISMFNSDNYSLRR